MRNSVNDYIKEIDQKIDNSKTNFKELKVEHLNKISFYQHERLIHLLVTLFYALFLISFIALSYLNNLFVFIFFILLIFLIFYVRHYFFLENSVQYMYKQYDKINDKITKKD